MTRASSMMGAEAIACSPLANGDLKLKQTYWSLVGLGTTYFAVVDPEACAVKKRVGVQGRCSGPMPPLTMPPAPPVPVIDAPDPPVAVVEPPIPPVSVIEPPVAPVPVIEPLVPELLPPLPLTTTDPLPPVGTPLPPWAEVPAVAPAPGPGFTDSPTAHANVKDNNSENATTVRVMARPPRSGRNGPRPHSSPWLTISQ